MDIDIVYTWVNANDPDWRQLHRETADQRVVPSGEHGSVDDEGRYQSGDELYYSIRSVQRYAPWVRKIFVLTNCRLPAWAVVIDNLVRVGHEEVFPRVTYLPTFNSHAIETVLHKIDGLSESFLYFNDDVFLCKPAKPEDFFPSPGKIYYFPSTNDILHAPPSASLRPADNGAINASLLLQRSFGFQPVKKLHHAPFALTRTLLAEIERNYPDEILATRRHQFRNMEDVAVATTLHAYYAACTNRGSERKVASRYVDIGDPLFLLLVAPLSPLMRGKYEFLCLNKVTDLRWFRRLRDRIIRRVMRSLFGDK